MNVKQEVFEKMKLIDSVKATKKRMIVAMDWTEQQYNNFLGHLETELNNLYRGINKISSREV